MIKLSFESETALRARIRRLKKHKIKFRVRGRLTKESRNLLTKNAAIIDGKKWPPSLEIRFFVYNDFKLTDVPILRKHGVKIHRWDLYIYPAQ